MIITFWQDGIFPKRLFEKYFLEKKNFWKKIGMCNFGFILMYLPKADFWCIGVWRVFQ